MVERLAEPIGDTFRYVAKLAYFYESTDSGGKPVNPGIRECWGVSEDEARSKLDRKVKDWINTRKGASA